MRDASHFGRWLRKSQETYPAIEVNFGPDRDVNFGMSVPVSERIEDRHGITLITGRRF